MTLYYYKVYETIIESEIEILNIPYCQEKGIISARIERTEKPSSHIPNGQFGTFYSPNLCALGAEWGTLEVTNGDVIQLYLKEGYEPHDAAPFIIGWGFGFLFHQQTYTVFHCSALNIGGKGVMISGVSGAGKSSTALSLIQSGAKYLVDDMAVMKPDESLDLIPAYPVQKVCRDVSINAKKENLLHINEGRDKFAYHNENDFFNQRLKMTHLILLNIHDGNEVIVKEHKGIDKYMRVMECMYLNELFASFGLPEKDKKNCLKLAQGIRVVELSRPRGKNTLEEITGIINAFVSE